MVSVIIPTFNREKTIERAIKSVLNQTYQDIEVIIVDDGSKDRTYEQIKRIDSDKIRYIYQENAGASAARNTGILAAKGEYIAFQDSDDYWYPDKLEKQFNVMKEQEADIVFCKLLRHNYEENSVLPDLDEGFVSHETLLRNPSVSTQTLMGKAEVFQKILFDTTLPALEDYAFSIRASQYFKFYHMKDVLVDLYLQDDSLTSNMRKYVLGNRMILEQYQDIWEHYPYIKAERLYVLGGLEARYGQNDVELFQESFSIQKSWKTLVKLILARLHLLSLITRQ